MNKYKKLAKAILSIDEQESNLKISKNKLEDSIAISNEFYNDFFLNLHVPNIDSKVAIYRRGYLEDYNGTCTVNRYLGNRAIDFKIFIPKEEDIKNAVTITHEKAHIYHALNNKKMSEEVPSFMDIIQAIYIDSKYFKGIKDDNINYKIKQAKKAAKIYLNKSKLFYSDKSLEYQINYMKDFLRTIILLENYLEDKEKVKSLVYTNLFEDSKNPIIKDIYVDDENYKKQLEFIKKI